jgi:glucuronokinase
MTIENFWAEVSLWESPRLRLIPHPLYDPSEFGSLSDLHMIGRREG